MTRLCWCNLLPHLRSGGPQIIFDKLLYNELIIILKFSIIKNLKKQKHLKLRLRERKLFSRLNSCYALRGVHPDLYVFYIAVVR